MPSPTREEVLEAALWNVTNLRAFLAQACGDAEYGMKHAAFENERLLRHDQAANNRGRQALYREITEKLKE